MCNTGFALEDMYVTYNECYENDQLFNNYLSGGALFGMHVLRAKPEIEI